jgi:hypothetical protein
MGMVSFPAKVFFIFALSAVRSKVLLNIFRGPFTIFYPGKLLPLFAAFPALG